MSSPGLTSSSTNTKTPILFVSNSIDPTSPLRGAKKMAGLFSGSGLLTVEGVGHGSITAPSKCTVKHVQTYLATGKVPPADTKCTPDIIPFTGKDLGWGKVLKSVY
jgi:hypothetical protein